MRLAILLAVLLVPAVASAHEERFAEFDEVYAELARNRATIADALDAESFPLVLEMEDAIDHAVDAMDAVAREMILKKNVGRLDAEIPWIRASWKNDALACLLDRDAKLFPKDEAEMTAGQFVDHFEGLCVKDGKGSLACHENAEKVKSLVAEFRRLGGLLAERLGLPDGRAANMVVIAFGRPLPKYIGLFTEKGTFYDEKCGCELEKN